MFWAKRQRGWRGGRRHARESERASLTGCICSTQRTLFSKTHSEIGRDRNRYLHKFVMKPNGYAATKACNKYPTILSLSLWAFSRMIFTSASAISTAKKCTIQHCWSSSSLRALCFLPIRIIQESTSPQHVRFALLKHFTRLLGGLRGP